MGSTASFVIGLTWGGVTHPWSSVQVLAPLILGVVGIGIFILYEGYVATNPIVRLILALLSFLITHYLLVADSVDFVEEQNQYQRVCQFRLPARGASQ